MFEYCIRISPALTNFKLLTADGFLEETSICQKRTLPQELMVWDFFHGKKSSRDRDFDVKTTFFHGFVQYFCDTAP